MCKGSVKDVELISHGPALRDPQESRQAADALNRTRSDTYCARNADCFPKEGSARSDCFDNDYQPGASGVCGSKSHVEEVQRPLYGRRASSGTGFGVSSAPAQGA